MSPNDPRSYATKLLPQFNLPPGLQRDAAPPMVYDPEPPEPIEVAEPVSLSPPTPPPSFEAALESALAFISARPPTAGRNDLIARLSALGSEASKFLTAGRAAALKALRLQREGVYAACRASEEAVQRLTSSRTACQGRLNGALGEVSEARAELLGITHQRPANQTNFPSRAELQEHSRVVEGVRTIYVDKLAIAQGIETEFGAISQQLAAAVRELAANRTALELLDKTILGAPYRHSNGLVGPAPQI